MARKGVKKFEKALSDLDQMIKFFDGAGGDEPAAFFAVSKAFEIAVEYGWKELKRRLEERGLGDCIAPKDVVRKSAEVGIIDDPERWLDSIDLRNASVHDYYGMTESEYLKLAREFLKEARRVFKG